MAITNINTSPTWSRRLNVISTVTMVRLRIQSRYPGQIILDILLPIFFASIPLLLGRSLTSSSGLQTFANNTGTSNYVAYMLIGGSMYTIAVNSLWNIGNWMWWEQQSGTLEGQYLAPVNRLWILMGVITYGMSWSILAFFISYPLGCLLFGANPLEGNILLAILFLGVGIVPIYGLCLIYGALMLRFKDIAPLLMIAQWVIAIFMGMFFPFSLLPSVLRTIALLFPPTWVNNGVRAAILDIGWITGAWYTDMGIVVAFALVVPMIGYALFSHMEKDLKRNEGIGQY